MPFDAKVINVMIAGPSDVGGELQNVHDIIHNWNVMHAQERRVVLLPLSWKSHASPEMGDRPQAIINRQVLVLCDLLVAFSNAPVHPNSVVEEQFQAVRKFREECEPRGIVETYSAISEFRESFSRQLTLKIIRNFKLSLETEAAIKEIARQDSVPPLSPEAKQLLLEGSADPNGTVMCFHVMEGLIVMANNKNFAEPGNARLEAMWAAAVQQLEDLKLMQPLSPERQVFSITHEGFKVADRLRQEPST